MERKQKSSAPRCSPPNTGSGSIKTPHGTELYDIIGNDSDIKNARSKVIWQAFVALSKCRVLQILVFTLYANTLCKIAKNICI